MHGVSHQDGATSCLQVGKREYRRSQVEETDEEFLFA